MTGGHSFAIFSLNLTDGDKYYQDSVHDWLIGHGFAGLFVGRICWSVNQADFQEESLGLKNTFALGVELRPPLAPIAILSKIVNSLEYSL